VYELSEIYGDKRFPVINWFPFFCKRYLEIKCFQLQWFTNKDKVETNIFVGFYDLTIKQVVLSQISMLRCANISLFNIDIAV
jgi:hypothetical protein